MSCLTIIVKNRTRFVSKIALNIYEKFPFEKIGKNIKVRIKPQPHIYLYLVFQSI